MSEQQFPRVRLYLTAVVMFAALAHLTWEQFTGGVASHHFLNRADMPAISNWWGALLLPVLTWFLTSRIQRRMAHHSGGNAAASTRPIRVVAGFVGALLFAILLSVAFTNDYETMASYVFLSMFLLALLLPVYRAECVLGFVLGMTFVFGAVLPTVIAAILAAVSAAIHLAVRPLLARFWTWCKRTVAPTA